MLQAILGRGASGVVMLLVELANKRDIAAAKTVKVPNYVRVSEINQRHATVHAKVRNHAP